jgi:hypothetical protein
VAQPTTASTASASTEIAITPLAGRIVVGQASQQAGADDRQERPQSAGANQTMAALAQVPRRVTKSIGHDRLDHHLRLT